MVVFFKSLSSPCALGVDGGDVEVKWKGGVVRRAPVMLSCRPPACRCTMMKRCLSLVGSDGWTAFALSVPGLVMSRCGCDDLLAPRRCKQVTYFLHRRRTSRCSKASPRRCLDNVGKECWRRCVGVDGCVDAVVGALCEATASSMTPCMAVSRWTSRRGTP